VSEQFVVFAIPAFDHSMIVEGVQSLIETDWALHREGIARGYQFVGGDPYLAKVRNLMATRCMRTYPQMTDFFFIDADVTWPAEAAVRLIKSPVDVVGGIYPKKNDNLEFPAYLEMTEDREFVVKDGLYKATGLPTGFLRIKRHVLERMAGVSGRYIDGTGGGEEAYNIFEMGYSAENEKATGRGEWWGEDFAWCRRWRDMGGELWADPDIDFGHRGQKTWRANFKKQGIDAAIASGRAKVSAPSVKAHEADFSLAQEAA
jgi:hypothetical protein